jgi:hypothetical protein
VHPGLRHAAEELHVTFGRLLLYAGALAILTVAAVWLFEPPAGQAAVDPVAKSDWVDVGKPFPAFQLRLPELSEPDPHYSIYRHAYGGGRKDMLGFGDAESISAQIMIEIYRPGRELERFADARSEVEARAAELGNVKALRATDAIASKFGPFWAFEFKAKGSQGMRQCVGFARAFEDPRLQIAGWSCKREGDIVDRGSIACALDRLTLIAAGSEPKIGDLFAVAEQHRAFCRQRDPLLAANRKRADWLNGGTAGKLRGRVAPR